MILSAADIESREFSIARKGYDRAQVRSFLTAAAESIRLAADEAERNLASAHTGSTDPDDDAGEPSAERDALGSVSTEAAPQLAPGVGDAVARILEVAQNEAASLVAAESVAIEIRAKVQQEVTELRSAADEYAADQRRRAEADAEQVRLAADQEAREAADSARIAREEAALVRGEAVARVEQLVASTTGELRTALQERLTATRSHLELATSAEREAQERIERFEQQAASLGNPTTDRADAVGP